jgi:hypothetical protein
VDQESAYLSPAATCHLRGVPVKLFPLILAALLPLPALACTPTEARELVEDRLLSMIDEANGCSVTSVGAERKSWWGYRNYPVVVECTNDPSVRRKTYSIFIDEKSGRCEFGF